MCFFLKNHGKKIKDMVYYVYKKIGNRKGDSMKNFDDFISVAKLSELVNKKEEKKDNKIVWTLAIIGAVAAVAAIAFAVYKYLTPDYLEDDDDFDDLFDDDFDVDDIEAVDNAE